MDITGRQKGFTFNEVLVAMNLIMVAVLGSSLSSVSVIRDQATNDNFTVAIHLAQDKIEELKTQANPTNENRCPESGERGISAIAAPGGIFDRCWRIVDSVLGSNLKQIDVTVSWRDYQPREVKLSTLVFADGGS
jgi:type II secretory pathway pseudopilin PulG